MIGSWVLSTVLLGTSLSAPLTVARTTSSLAAVHAAPLKQGVTLGVNYADGAKVTGEIKFVVKVDAKDPVTQVEFYVNDNIRDSDSSTPYEFTIDTLAEADGPLKVVFAAYTTEGHSSKKTVNLVVDNGLSKGADYHVSAGREFLTQRNFDDAIRCGRIALKIQAKYNPARMLLARAFFGKGVLDSAQKFAEDVVMEEPKNYEAADLLSGIHLRRAFSAVNRGGEKSETLNIIKGALKAAVESRRKVLDANVDSANPTDDASRLQFADLAIKAGRYSLAIGALSEKMKSEPTDPAFGNRVVYAQLRSSRFDDAANTLTAMKRVNALDAYSYSLWSIVEAVRGRDQESDDMMKEAILVEPDSLGVQAAQTWIALKRGRTSALQNLATKLAKDEGQRSEIQYYIAVLQNNRGNYADAQRAFERSLLAEPTNYDMFIQRGNEALGIVAAKRVEEKELGYQTQVATAYFETALVAKADSAEALTGLAIVNMFDKKINESLRFAKGSTGAGATYAPAHYISAMVHARVEAEVRAAAARIRQNAPGGRLSPEQQTEVNRLLSQANEYGKEAMALMKKAEMLDQTNLRGRGIPEMNEAFNYFSRHGRLPLLIAPR